MARIDERLEVLEGYLIAYLNLDRVIAIIRSEDEPKPVLMAEFDLIDIQAEAILNMRLRSLRKLEEMELKRELDELQRERVDLDDLLASKSRQWGRIADQLKATAKAFGKDAGLGARRTELADAPQAEDVPADAMIEREPVTVVCSTMGWIRAMKGHLGPEADLKYKDGDAGRFVLNAETTDKVLLFASNGRFYTLAAHLLPGGRGMGEPVRLMIDLPNESEILALMVFRGGERLLVASSAGDGFVVPQDDVLAQTRTGKQVLESGCGCAGQGLRASGR